MGQLLLSGVGGVGARKAHIWLLPTLSTLTMKMEGYVSMRSFSLSLEGAEGGSVPGPGDGFERPTLTSTRALLPWCVPFLRCVGFVWGEWSAKSTLSTFRRLKNLKTTLRERGWRVSDEDFGFILDTVVANPWASVEVVRYSRPIPACNAQPRRSRFLTPGLPHDSSGFPHF